MILEQNKFIQAGAFGILALIIVALVFQLGRSNGRAEVHEDWHEETRKQDAAIAEVRADFAARLATHQQETQRISDAIFQSNEAHRAALASIAAGFDQRMRASEERAGVYQRLAEAGPAEQASLASHAAQLDGSLEQGRRLVEELRLTLGQREAELRLLGEQILSDRQAVEGAASISENSSENTGK